MTGGEPDFGVTLVGVCENCAGEDEELELVWRLPAGSTEAPELWCADCRDRHPHELAENGEGQEDE